MASFTANNTFYKTFSGTDTLAFAIFPESKPILLGSLTTLSYSIYREKKPVPLLGKINTGGFTRGMRTIAGTMVFTLINQHFAKDIVEQIPYLEAHGKVKSDELPFFDVMVICANEYGTSSQMMIYGAEFVDDQQVISINDMYIENVFGFVARDIDTFDNKNYLSGKGSGEKTIQGNSGIYGQTGTQTIDTVMPYDFNLNGYKDFMNRTLLSTENTKVYSAQLKLNELNLLNRVSGVLDNETMSAISMFQTNNKIQDTGILDELTYSLLNNSIGENEIVSIVNKNGAFVYSNINKDNVIGISKYKESYLGLKKSDMVSINFNGKNGYIDIDNTNLKSKPNLDFYDYAERNKQISLSLDNFDPKIIGAGVIPNVDTEMKITAISYYDKSVKSLSKYVTVYEDIESSITLSLIPESFIYNIDEGSMPSYIEFIIYPLGNEPIKWMVKFK